MASEGISSACRSDSLPELPFLLGVRCHLVVETSPLRIGRVEFVVIYFPVLASAPCLGGIGFQLLRPTGAFAFISVGVEAGFEIGEGEPNRLEVFRREAVGFSRTEIVCDASSGN